MVRSIRRRLAMRRHRYAAIPPAIRDGRRRKDVWRRQCISALRCARGPGREGQRQRVARSLTELLLGVELLDGGADGGFGSKLQRGEGRAGRQKRPARKTLRIFTHLYLAW